MLKKNKMFKYACNDIKEIFTIDQALSLKDCVFYCLDCNNNLVPVKAHERNTNGQIVSVQSHFRHNHDSDNKNNCSNESIEHKAAKEFIFKNIHKIQFTVKCLSCHDILRPHIYNYTRDNVPIKSLKPCKEFVYDQFRIDVGLVDDNKKLKFAIEVFKTHKLSEDKIRKFNETINWIEISADSVLKSIDKNKYTIQMETQKCKSCLYDAEKAKDAENIKLDSDKNIIKAEKSIKSLDLDIKNIICDKFDKIDKIDDFPLYLRAAGPLLVSMYRNSLRVLRSPHLQQNRIPHGNSSYHAKCNR